MHAPKVAYQLDKHKMKATRPEEFCTEKSFSTFEGGPKLERELEMILIGGNPFLGQDNMCSPGDE
eukprot:CAMPEP_0194062206 /NCGR_PEP_ID=MMETSP0009_2-20130614/76813_1 /TAXON_ID=210454 /ORGANISM="Grammatophora oceanica, Strain CCMP 410" /LENGTH=64 /DNA_ID=CAMNT_0038713857 /DNA_START=135 /DNA_END=329 /DNA_ORIENTATION=+